MIDHVLATGEPVEIERHGKRVLLVPAPGAGKWRAAHAGRENP